MLTKKYNALKQQRLSIMNNDGKIINSDDRPDFSDERLLEAFKIMLFSRTQEEKMLQFQRQGRLLTFLANIGQEAANLGAVMATEDKDWLVPAFRSNAAWIYKGMPLKKSFLFWNGDERGNIVPDNINLTPINVPIGTQISHATGIAMSIKYKKEDAVVLTFIGDGGTSEGEFYEAVNFAANFDAPVVFLIQNNQFAISTSRKIQTKCKTLAQKGIAAGIPNIQVDGNDLLAVYAATKEAVDRARNGEGPTLIEAVTYRLAAHSTSDDPTIYRDPADYEAALKVEPLIRLRKYLTKKQLWSEEQEAIYLEEISEQIKTAFNEIENTPTDDISQIFEHMFAKMTPDLERQLEEAKKYNNMEA